MNHAAKHASVQASAGVSTGYLRRHPVARVVDSITQFGLVAEAANDVGPRVTACSVLAEALSTAGVSREAAGVAIGISKTRVDMKCSAMAANVPPTLADALALIDAGGRPLDAAQVIVDALQSRIDQERSRTTLTVDCIGPLAMGIVAAMGSLCDGLGAALARKSIDDASDLRRRCLAVQRQVAVVAAILGRIR